MTLTTEQIEQVIDDCRKGAAMRGLFNKWIVEEMASELLRCRERLAELSAVANREAQPVLYVSEETLAYAKEGEKSLVTWSEPMGDAVIPLYTAPPAPAVPEEIPEADRGEGGSDIDYMQTQEIYDMGKTDGWNACRAAMLAQPVSGGYKLPDGWIACSERMPQDGVVVLCYEGGDISTLFHRGNGVWDDGDFHSNITGVTHWMPLPAAPEGGK